MKEFGVLDTFPQSRHFLAEIIMSLALIKSDKCENFPPDFNVLTPEWKDDYNWGVVHYGAISNLNKFTGSLVVNDAIQKWDFNK